MILAFWIIISSLGLTNSFLIERSRRLLCMSKMAEGLKRLGFYISRWQLPLEEAFETLGKEEAGILSELYAKIAAALKSRQTSDLGTLWKEESRACLRSYALPGAVMDLWCGAFADMAPLPLEEQRRLELRAQQIEKICAAMEEKYRQERRPLLAAGVCAGAVWCLLMW
ncbi:MAG: stage III sporulation protein AB [Lachnospiraceae bacterium]|nr:stage III sporulation protein AB [Lachnospiraceae bacterium]